MRIHHSSSMADERVECRSHAELDSASHKTLNQVQGDKVMTARAESITFVNRIMKDNYQRYSK